ncbi:peptidoglycan-binding LysM domain-containing protein [Dictyostelium discoideum AX4]|uniref:Peptidoglycan-binding LysM domain-containing protein n=1 Tax=Dictyostelium discoideum TaxID=44689 RepID=Q54DD6_DICDI|nr:peptidoglycan-binding LysM domain-containing protein [Dictyostelium discoideum AX4]EAL61285.2 peptidoglycan-binding LysM domain-containing protein [Dictyostelium discoideum AX4]|eukprot:XP_629705.2 peptidoglycan-binding LysM domain-containing protein [Dictyostelium discoideum AX4]
MSDWDFLNGTTSNSSSPTTTMGQFNKSRNNSRESGLSQLMGTDEYDDSGKTMSTFSKTTTPPQIKNSAEKSKYLVHQLTPKDTLQGLALKYNVKVNDIKRLNNMWTQDSLFIKKTILIPIEVSDLVTSENNSNSSGSGNNSLNSSSNNIKNLLDGSYGVNNTNSFISNNNNNNNRSNNNNNNSGTSFDNVFPEFEKMNKTFGTPKEKPILPPSTFNNGSNGFYSNSNNNNNNNNSFNNNNNNNNNDNNYNNSINGLNRPQSTLSFSPVVNSLDHKTQTHFSLLDDEWNPL